MKRIFIVLGGEDRNKKPRVKRLMHALSRLESLDGVRVVLTGYDIEVDEMRSQLLENNFSKDIIIEERCARDTLGNLVFSYDIVSCIVKKYREESFKIFLITEGFHLKRAKKLFLLIFKNLLFYNQEIDFDFIGANTKGISRFYWKRRFLVLIEKFKRKILQGNEVSEYFGRIKMITTRHSFDYLVMDIILTDFDIFRIKSLEDIRNYLYNLYLYKEKFKPNHRILMQFSIYELILKISRRSP